VPAFHKYLIPCAPSIPSAHFKHMRQRVTIAPLEADGTVEGLIVTIEDVTARHDRDRSGSNPSEDQAPLARLDDESWSVRKNAAEDVGRNAAPSTIAALLIAVRDQHHNLGLLNSALKVLELTNVDTHSTLVEFLEGDDVDLRMQAALALGSRKDLHAVPALMKALGDPDPNVVYHAIEALGRIGALEACDALLSIAEHQDFFLAFPAIEALGEIGDSRVAPRLVPFLQNELLRDAAVRALAKVGDEFIVPALVDLLNRSTPAEAIASSLANLYDRYERQFNEGRHIADLCVTAITPGGIQNLLDAVVQAHPSNLRCLVLVLGWLHSPAAARALALHLGSADLRGEITEALVRHGELVTDLLLEQLGSEDLEVRSAAVNALGRIRDRKSVPALIHSLNVDSELAIPAIGALASIGDRNASSALLGVLANPDDAVRRAAVSALNTLASPELVERVIPLLDDANPLVREAAVRIAGYFGYRGSVEAILERCQDQDERVRRAAITHLPYLDDARATRTLVQALRDETASIRAAAASAAAHMELADIIPEVIRALEDPDSWVRYFAAQTLGRHRVSEAAGSLEALARSDRFPQVRIAAFEALSLTAGERAIDVAATFIASRDLDLQRAAAEALKTLHDPESLSLLKQLLRSPHAIVRAAAAAALGDRADAGAMDDLRQVVMTDAESHVTRAAAFALKKLPSADATSALMDVLADPDRRDIAVDVLSELQKADVDALREGFLRRSPGVRLALVSVFERLKRAEATQLLHVAAGDEDPAVQAAAVAALARNQRT
ncbi:MAG TPA: HEAT repeat domain-containing protein, partial [Terriglobia bacterium]|nr:HEAT repeat domain-containing protein [Terriglobia bacterium]